jgi:integrase
LVKSNDSSPARKSKPAKPAKPHEDFPLFPHATGRWCKKVRGKLHYFGRWDDPDKALELWLVQKDDLLAGRTPRTIATEGMTVDEMVNRFLDAKRHQVDTCELSARTWSDYRTACSRVKGVFGARRLVPDLAADDFARLRNTLAKTLGPVALGCEINRIRVAFKWAYEAGLIDKPVRYGPGFKRPSAKTLRKARQAKGVRMFDAADLRRIIEKAGVPLKAMILLGINVGFGNNDCATLPISAVNLKTGWVDFPRPKTAIARRAKLWPETVTAIEAAFAERPTPKHGDDHELMFITARRLSWAKAREVQDNGKGIVKVTADNPVSKEFRKVLKALKLHKPGFGFYTLRHIFLTVAEETRDNIAVAHVMGHVVPGIGTAYREKVGDDRLEAVSSHVRTWLLTNGRKPEENQPEEAA